MAGSYHGQVHEENLKRLEEFHQVSKKNRYRKCLVTCSEKNPKFRGEKWRLVDKNELWRNHWRIQRFDLWIH